MLAYGIARLKGFIDIDMTGGSTTRTWLYVNALQRMRDSVKELGVEEVPDYDKVELSEGA